VKENNRCAAFLEIPMGKGNQKEALKLESIVCETTIATTKK
jgi:hypothetical protein